MLRWKNQKAFISYWKNMVKEVRNIRWNTFVACKMVWRNVHLNSTCARRQGCKSCQNWPIYEIQICVWVRLAHTILTLFRHLPLLLGFYLLIFIDISVKQDIKLVYVCCILGNKCHIIH